MKRILVVGVFALLATTAVAQSNWEGTKAGPGHGLFVGPHLTSSGWRFGGFSLFGASFGRGFLGGGFHGTEFYGPRRSSFCGFPGGRLMFGDHYEGMYPWWGFSEQFGPQPSLYSSQSFVEQWKDYPPFREVPSGSQETALSQSILLAEGMSEEQVLTAVGSPIQKVTLGERTVWKYSGYSLLFEGGSLKEIR
jgi:hypothetical protein